MARKIKFRLVFEITKDIIILDTVNTLKHGSIRSSDNDSTDFCQPGSLHTLGADGHI